VLVFRERLNTGGKLLWRCEMLLSKPCFRQQYVLTSISVTIFLFVTLQKAGTAAPSFVSNLVTDLEHKEKKDEEMEQIRNCAGLAYAGDWIITA
jgi:hypothetical protein